MKVTIYGVPGCTVDAEAGAKFDHKKTQENARLVIMGVARMLSAKCIVASGLYWEG